MLPLDSRRSKTSWRGISRPSPNSRKSSTGWTASCRARSSRSTFLGLHPADVKNTKRNALVRPLQEQVKAKGLWACHLGPELGGQGYGQVKLGLMNEILGRAEFAPSVFGCQAPDTGNAEIIAHYGTAEQKEQLPKAAAERRDRQRLLDDRAAGRRPTPGFITARRARRRRMGDQRREMVLDQRTMRPTCSIVMAVTDPDAEERLPAHVDVPRPDRHAGREILRNVGIYGGQDGSAGLCALRRRARPGRPFAGRARRRVRDRADPARRRSHPSRDAHRRRVQEGARHDVPRARVSRKTRDGAARRQADGAGCTSPTAVSSSNSSGC